MNKMNNEMSFLKMLKGMKADRLLKYTCIFALGLTLSACKGRISDKPPIHINPNMDDQPRKEAQEENSFFEDGRSMRQPVEGTVARGFEKSDGAYYEGVDESGDFIASNPVDITRSFLYRGKERYEIFCSPCHGMSGAGDGIIMNYGYVPAPSFYDPRIQSLPDGEIYSAIHNGVRTMPSYRTQIPVEDRWAIVAYVNALQSTRVSESEISEYDEANVDELKEEYQKELERLDSLAAAREAEQPEETEAGEEGTASAELGEQLFVELTCQVCHSTDGSSGIGPSVQGMYNSEGEVITEEGETITVTKDEEYITESILNPMAKKPVDFENQIMSQIPVETQEVEALIEYIKTLSEN
ncbi:MAG: c-type cytochrome [Balneolaceae bacterium]